MFFFTFYLTQLWGNVGTPCPGIVRLPAEQRSSFWCKSADSKVPGAFSAGGRRNSQSGSAGVPLLALLLPLLSFKEVAMTPGWLPLIFIFVPAGVLTVWHFAESNNHIGCTCPFCRCISMIVKLLQTRAWLIECARACRLILALSLGENTYQNLLFTSYCCTTHYVEKEIIFSKANYVDLITLCILVWGWTRLVLWFLVLFIMYTVFDCHSYRFQK